MEKSVLELIDIYHIDGSVGVVIFFCGSAVYQLIGNFSVYACAIGQLVNWLADWERYSKVRPE